MYYLCSTAHRWPFNFFCTCNVALCAPGEGLSSERLEARRKKAAPPPQWGSPAGTCPEPRPNLVQKINRKNAQKTVNDAQNQFLHVNLAGRPSFILPFLCPIFAPPKAKKKSPFSRPSGGQTGIVDGERGLKKAGWRKVGPPGVKKGKIGPDCSDL